MRVYEAARTVVTHAVAGLAVAAGVALAAAVPAHADQPIKVFLNHARILKLNRPVERVIIGNSNIADVTVADPKTIVLTGKAYGTTNLVILGKNDSAIVDKNVLVAADEANTIRVYRQTNRTLLSCGPNCEIDPETGAKAP